MKKIALFMMFFGVVFMSVMTGQTKKPKISFNETAHDFGKIDAGKGKVSYTFTYMNTGGDTLRLSNVRTSCGCTVSKWSKDPIPPGGTGKLVAIFNPHGRSGAFHKTVTVTSNAVNPTVVLKLYGQINPKPRTVADNFPQRFRQIRMKTNHLAFSNIKNTEVKTDSLAIVNNSADTVKLGIERIPAHLTIKFMPSETLLPHQKGHIVITYDAAKKNDWGFLIDRMYLTINGKRITNNRLITSATIHEDFSKLTEKERKKAPHIQFESTKFNFDTITQGDKITHEFKFKNTGKSDLIIRKMKTSCGCTASLVESKIIPKGKSSSIKAIFNSRGKTNHQHKTITVITNDPDHPTTRLEVTGFVKHSGPIHPKGVKMVKPKNKKPKH